MATGFLWDPRVKGANHVVYDVFTVEGFLAVAIGQLGDQRAS